jgi:hypothetical protein
MATRRLTLSEFDFELSDEGEQPPSPEIPIRRDWRRSRAGQDGDSLRSGADIRDSDRSPVNPTPGRNCPPISRALFPPESEPESPIQCPQRERRKSGDQSAVLLELKEMLSKVCKKVDQNERVLKELQGGINSGATT